MSKLAFPARYGSWALVAGASEGLGAAFAESLARRGCNLVLIARRADVLEEFAAKLRTDHKIEALPIALDLSNDAWLVKVRDIAAQHEIGIGVYNAAYSFVGPLLDHSLEQALRVVEVNAAGALRFTHVLAPAMVARRRLERGVRLNYPEAIALITDFVVEGARDGRSVAELMQAGAHVLSADQVMPGVAEMIHDVQVEATFPDGTKLVTVHEPIRGGSHAVVPGEIITEPGDIVMNSGRESITLTVANTGDRPIQVGSHYHFAETNAALSFDREKAHGMRLDIPAGTAVRFEPGQTRDVQLVAYEGNRTVYGFRQQIMGRL